MFQFRFQRLFNYRRRQAESLARALHIEQQRVRREEVRLEALQTERQVQQQQFEATQGNTLLNEELKMLHLAQRGLAQRIEAQEVLLARAAVTLAAQQQALVKARQAEKTLEKLRAKQEQRDALAHTRREQSLVDEVATTRFHHEHTAFADGNAQ